MKKWFTKVNDIEITFYIGCTQQDNKELIDKSADDDMWFHVSENPSAHVVCNLSELCITDKKILRKIIKQGALCCKIHSKYANQKNLKIVYCLIKNLETTDIAGKVIPHNEKYITI